MHPSRIEMARPWKAMRAVEHQARAQLGDEASLSVSPSVQMSPMLGMRNCRCSGNRAEERGGGRRTAAPP